ncbi:paraneoplastic antigen Ma1-like [Mobula birostris]|uniref:paraneoplastic antigen Ma1-like n=1 Tax=Mobula birostris TaxID=1983395 RepID=UPI003B28208D
MDSGKIELWCEIEDVPVNHACVLSGVDMRTPDDVLIRCLSTVRAIGKVEIVSRKIGKTGDPAFVLVQTGADVKELSLPPCIGEAGPWGVHTVTEEGSEGLPEARGGDFGERVQSFLKNEGRGWSDLENVISSHSPLKWEDSELASAINSLVNWAVGPRQKLRMFSGRTPTPEGEDDYETWIEDTAQLLGEWQCSEQEKRQRLGESLRGVAAQVVKDVTFDQPSASWRECLDALEEAFGLTEGIQNLRQEKGEKLSEYLFRLERRLDYLRRRELISGNEVARIRIDQVVRGAQRHDAIATSLRLSHRMRPLPSFIQLLREVREEEAALEAEGGSAPRGEMTGASSTREIAKGVAAGGVSPREGPRGGGPSRAGWTTLRPGGGRGPARRGVCYNCGEEGHFRRECKRQGAPPRESRRVSQQERRSGNLEGTQ